MLENPKLFLFQIFQHYETVKISHFFVFLSKNFRKTPNGPPSFFWKFCNRMDVKKSQRAPFLQFSALWDFSKGIIFLLKIGFLRPSTLYPIFVFLKDRYFFCDFFEICFHRSPPQFLEETKRFASPKDSSRFLALCDLPETNFENSGNKISQSVLLKGFPLKTMGFLLFPVREEWLLRLMCIPSGLFWRCRIDEILTFLSFHLWFSV